jgi:Flp pilus assembly pilin Flp
MREGGDSVLRRLVWRVILGLRASERGEVYVEYVVLAALAVLAILGAVQYFFNAVSALFQRLASALGGL